MSQSLSQSLRKLTVRPPSLPCELGCPTAPTKMQLLYPTFTSTPKFASVSTAMTLQDWLINHAKTNIKDHAQHDWTFMSAVVDILQAQTRIRTLDMETAFVNPPSPATLSYQGIDEGSRWYSSYPFVPITPSYTGGGRVRRRSYIMGRQPRWWIDYELPSYQ